MDNTTSRDDLWTVRQFAQHLGVSKPTAYKIMKEPGFPVLSCGRILRIPAAGFEKWAQDRMIKQQEARQHL